MHKQRSSNQGRNPFTVMAYLLACLAAWVSPLSATAQIQVADIGLVARIHFNTQTRDFAKTRAFYRLLGYTEGQSDYPKTNTHQMARSLGMYDLCTYELEQIEVMFIPGAMGPTSIDLIKFKTPYNDEPPYANTNHLGMAYAALASTDFEADYAFLKSQGVPFLSDPYGKQGQRFVFMQDPDGVFIKLVETAPLESTPENAATHIVAMPYIGINVSDFDQALAFYKRLGYTDVKPLEDNVGDAEHAAAYGLDAPFKFIGADVSLPRGDQHTLRIIQWLTPFDDTPPYPAPISHIGIHRIALAVMNLDHAVSTLSGEGVQFLSDIAPCCSGTGADEVGIINALDPDGTFVELVGPIEPRPLKPPPSDCQ